MATQPSTEALIREIELFLQLPITQLRAHATALAPMLIERLRELERDAERKNA